MTGHGHRGGPAAARSEEHETNPPSSTSGGRQRPPRRRGILFRARRRAAGRHASARRSRGAVSRQLRLKAGREGRGSGAETRRAPEGGPPWQEARWRRRAERPGLAAQARHPHPTPPETARWLREEGAPGDPRERGGGGFSAETPASSPAKAQRPRREPVARSRRGDAHHSGGSARLVGHCPRPPGRALAAADRATGKAHNDTHLEPPRHRARKRTAKTASRGRCRLEPRTWRQAGLSGSPKV